MAVDCIKIVHLITGLDTGGAEVSLQRLTGAMDRDRFENIVVSLTHEGPLSISIRDQGIRVETIGMSRNVPSPMAFWRLYRLLQAERPDILQTWLYHSDLFGLLAGRASRVPAVAWNIRCSNMGEEYRQGINGMLLRILAKLSKFPDAIVANSHAGQSEHEALGYQPKRWEVLQNGFDLDTFKPDADAPTSLRKETNLANDAIIIGLVGRYDPIKDHASFIRAAGILHATYENVHFVLAGGDVDPDNHALNSMIDRQGIRNNTHLLGRRNDIPRLNAGFDIAVCCSLGEGFPNVVGEAMACAVPCVVTDVGDAAQIVGDIGIVVPPGNSAELAGALRKMILMDANIRKQLGLAALSRIKEQYSLTRCVERYQNFYETLAGI